MAFLTPDLKTLIDRMDSDAESRLPGAQPRLRRSIIGAVIRAVAASMYGFYQLLQNLINYLMPDTATGWILDRWAGIFLSVTRKAATAATGSVDFTGTDGTQIPAGSILTRTDGVEYSTDELVSIAGGIASVSVTAVVAGDDGNAAAGVTVSLTSPIAGVNSDATVDGNAITGGADIESDASLRERLLNVLSNPPQGGNANDYIVWAREVPGVTRAWSYPLEGGAGNVVVRFMMDDTYADGIPLAADVTTVDDYIQALHPAAAVLTTTAPVGVALNFTISVSPNTQAVKDAVQAELEDLIVRVSQPGGTILLSHINEAIAQAAGETDHAVTVPAADVDHTINQIAVMGAITWN